jgi:uncharacterized cupredoxin-like copper-binding protein
VAEQRPPGTTSAGEHPAVADRRQSAPATPRWVWAIGLVALVLIVILIAAQLLFGVQHEPGMHGAAGGGTSSITPTASTGVTGSGLGGPAEATDANRSIEVTALDTMTFEPDTLEVAAGETVTFIVTNNGQTAHEFTLGDVALQQEHADAMAHLPDGMPHDLPNSIRLEAGETKELTWRFGHAQSLEYACHEPGHYDGGMRGTIVVG